MANVLQNNVENGSTIIDVGANIGLTVLLAYELVANANIVAIEPSDIAFACLKQTVATNSLQNVKLIHACAGSASGGGFRFVEIVGFLAGSHMVACDSPNATPTISVDSLVRDLHLTAVDFVKIDVEGFEIDVLQGMSETIERFAPLIFVEFNSFTISAFRNMSPRHFLEQAHAVGALHFQTEQGVLQQIASEDELVGFIHTNMLKHGCVDELLIVPSRRSLALKQRAGS